MLFSYRTNGALAGSQATAPRATTAATAGPRGQATVVLKLRQSNAKRRAEEEADAALAVPASQRLRSTAAAPTAIFTKRIAIVSPPGTQSPAAPEQLGCHLARRCRGPGGNGHRGGSGGGGNIGPSSLARVYGSRLRISQLPEDYEECFVGLEPVRQPDPDELLVAHVGSAQRKAAAAAIAGAGGAPHADSGGGGGLGGALLGTVGVGQEMSFMFPGVTPGGALATLVPGAPTATAAAAPAATVAGGLLAPLGHISAGLPMATAILPYTSAPYDAVAGTTMGGPAAAAAAVVAGPDLMLDADDSTESEEEEGDVSAGGGGQSMDTDAALGAAFDDFEGMGPMTQPPRPQPHPGGDGYGTGFGGGAVGAGGGMFGYGTGGGGSLGFGGMASGLPGSGMGMGMSISAGGGGGGGFGTGTGTTSTVDDDGFVAAERWKMNLAYVWRMPAYDGLRAKYGSELMGFKGRSMRTII
ncbi:hypothetical protein VOLCADRAFT_92242 [Volvox carteri f. nagariensis]|uniref:Uncharacterized protein n=1 Tax=Volvox carteri f. nagariensis TaxID=3068 RepID=D8TZ50_VOLCA|nr:uncharacterized protein VOLCADRAFT_92242 [Volvox carteri f. nagariensis]EFJ47215.1 hypothetical protein VOLCADRAFT_92242 [Volvox carteri f. nagariensis]|eukprot:XP_002951764.1 hypothetical protein VOLCADRAFT_92242 [Volvox carteri f. nagariensis]